MPKDSSIAHFKSRYLERGLARPNRYAVEFSVGGRSSVAHDTFGPITHAESVTLPSRSFVTIQEQWIGPVRNIPIGQKFDDGVVIAFPLSDDQTERSFFEQWMDAIVKPDTNEGDYKVSVQEGTAMIISTLGMDGEVTSTFTFNEVYPAKIMPTQLDMGSRNAWSSITVQFEYRTYEYKKN